MVEVFSFPDFFFLKFRSTVMLEAMKNVLEN